VAYNDKVTGEQKVNESRKVVDVDGPKGEVDRVYFRGSTADGR
jgi:glucose-6-phosphate 1-epimerase